MPPRLRAIKSKLCEPTLEAAQLGSVTQQMLRFKQSPTQRYRSQSVTSCNAALRQTLLITSTLLSFQIHIAYVSLRNQWPALISPSPPPLTLRPRVQGGGDGAESHDLLAAGRGRRCQLAAGGGGGRDEGTEEGFHTRFHVKLKIQTDDKRVESVFFLATVCAGLQERGGGERHRVGPTEGHSLSAGGDRPRGVPLLLGYDLPQRLGE